MEHCVILFAANLSEYAFLPEFSGLSALERSLLWAKNDSKSSKTVIFTSPDLKSKVEEAVKTSGIDADFEVSDSWTNALLAEKTSSACEKTGSDFALFAFADSPFLSAEESLKIASTHTEYKAEYTFADGWPLSLTPVAVDAGAAGIIAELGKSSQKSAGEKSVSRNPFWEIMAGDINSFEIEAEIAEKDFRLYRFDFSCSNKLNFLSCKNLFESNSGLFAPDGTYDILALSEAAEKNPAVLQSLPSYFEIQISSKCHGETSYAPYPKIFQNHPVPAMKIEDFEKILSKIQDFNESARISLSLRGEAFLHPDFADFVKLILEKTAFQIFIETDGIEVSEEVCKKISDFSPNVNAAKDRIDWAVAVDAMSYGIYSKIHSGRSEEDFKKALDSTGILQKYFPGHVYPQMTRMNVNECELETFYRFWKKPDSPTDGKVLIQKYDSLCGSLTDEKPADLSPLERNVCWHLRRDFDIYADGSVTACKSLLPCRENILGNALTDSLEEIWIKKRSLVACHMEKNYGPGCGKCDEYYTFNF